MNAHYYHPRVWPLWLLLGGVRLLSLLPLPLLHLIGGAIGSLLYRISKKHRAIAARNIQLCFPEKSQEQQAALVKEHFRHFGKAIFDVGVGSFSSKKRLERLVEFENKAIVDEYLSQGRAVIFLVPHFLCIPLGAVCVSELYPLLTMYKKPKQEFVHSVYKKITTQIDDGLWFNQWFFGSDRTGQMTLVEHRQGLKRILSGFKQGRAFYYLPDQNLGRRHTIFAPFFGIQAATVSAIRRLVKLSNAVVIPCSPLHKEKGQGYVIRFHPPLPAAGDDDLEYIIIMNKAIEDLIRQTPEQYFWLHKRFSTRPQGEPGLYNPTSPK